MVWLVLAMTCSPSILFWLRRCLLHSQLILWWIIFWFEGTYSAGNKMCASPQYVKLGTQGMISCAFPETFHGIFWYDNENVTSDDRPFISFVGGVKRGPGYGSEEYDIHPNGSLIINSASHLHNHFYGVALVESTERDPTFEAVSVIVFANPVGQYPHIMCEDEEVCFLKVKSETSLRCSIDGVGEIIEHFSWILRTREVDDSTFSQQVVKPISDNELQSFRVDVTIPLKDSPSLSLYVCSSTSPVLEVGSGEAIILVDHGTRSQNELPQTPLEKSLNEAVTMECGEGIVFFLVWQKDFEDVEPIAYTVSQRAGARIHKTNREGFTLENDNSLTIKAIDEHSVGVYTCLYSNDGTTTSYISYDVTILENESRRRDGLIVLIVLPLVFLVIVLISLLAMILVHLLRRFREKAPYGDTVHVESQVELMEEGSELPTDNAGRVVLSSKESEDTHRNTLQKLENVSESKVKLDDCFLSVEINGSALRLTSNVLVDPIAKMRNIYIEFPSDGWREFDEGEVKSILQYATRCKALEEIYFDNTLLPLELKDSIKETETKAIVEWTTRSPAGVFRLNFETGKWKNTAGNELSKDDYNTIKQKANLSKEVAAEQPGDENTKQPLMQDARC